MLYELAIVLCLMAVLLELAIVGRFPVLAAAFRRHSLAGLLFSLGVSFALGEVFAAHGLVVLLAAVGSTLVTTAVYRTGGLALMNRLTGMVARLVKT